jgi:hypothetical protein
MLFAANHRVCTKFSYSPGTDGRIAPLEKPRVCKTGSHAVFWENVA